MSRTILYYNVYITYNSTKTNIRFSDLIDRIRPLNEVERFWNEKKLSLLHMNLIDIENPLNAYNRSFAIAKYRDSYKPYTGRIGTNIANPITDDVIEFTCCYYIERSKQLAIEYNHIGSRPNEIAKYFSSFLPKTEDNIWGISLEPIDASRGLNTIRQASKINSIEFKIDCTQSLPEQFAAENFFTNFLRKTVESHLEFGANTASIKFGNGRKRLDIIEAQTLIQLVSLLDIEDDIFSSVKIDFENSEGKKDTIDLKNGNILKSIIMENEDITSYEYILNQMEISYVLNNQPGSISFQRFKNLLQNVSLPEIIVHTSNEVVSLSQEGA